MIFAGPSSQSRRRFLSDALIPQDHQAVHQQTGRNRATDRFGFAVLRFAQSEMLFAIMESDFSVPIIIPPKKTLLRY